MLRFPLSLTRLSRGRLSGLLLTASLSAQVPSPPALSFQDALQRASEQHPSLGALVHEERVAEALAEQAGVRPNPSLALEMENFAGTGSLRGVRGLEATVQANQILERGGKREKRIALAAQEVSATSKRSALERLAVQASTATAYIDVLHRQTSLRLADEAIGLARATVAAVDVRVQAGLVSPAEAARARAALATTEAEALRSKATLEASFARLAGQWGEVAPAAYTVLGEIRLPAALPELETLARSLGEHPRLSWERSRVEGRRAALELEQAQATQDVEFSGGVRFLRDGSDAAWVAGLSFPLPVRHRNQGQIRAAREAWSAAEQTRRAEELQLKAELTAAWHELAAAWEVARALRSNALPATEDAYHKVRQAYEQGALPFIDVLEAERDLNSLRRDVAAADAEYAFTAVRIDYLTQPDFASVRLLLSQP